MIEVRAHRPGTADEAALKALFEALYAHMSALGLGNPLVEDGASLWLGAVTPMLGKLSFVHLAVADDQVVGFVAGTVRTLPAHLGGARTGALTHIHVSADRRGEGIGHLLFQALRSSFEEKGVTRMETDVLVANADGRSFFRSIGFREDHVVLHLPIG